MKTPLLLFSSAILFGCSEKPTTSELQSPLAEQPQSPAKQEQSLTFQQKLERDAANGDATAKFDLGLRYFSGTFDGISQDDSKALEWFKKAALQGNVKAQNMLGFLYTNGRGTRKDDIKAVEWWEKAASQGDTDSQLKAGLSYLLGSGVPKNESKAAEYFLKPATQGNVVAQGQLAKLYANGAGVSKDFSKAAEWCEMAAMQGDKDSQSLLAGMYGVGRGVPKDQVRAYAWINIAATQGKEEDAKFRDLLENGLTPEQKAEAQKLSAEIFTKIKNAKP